MQIFAKICHFMSSKDLEKIQVMVAKSYIALYQYQYFVMNVGHFGHGQFGLGRFGQDISATDVSATKNAKDGRFGQNHKFWVGVCACINV